MPGHSAGRGCQGLQAHLHRGEVVVRVLPGDEKVSVNRAAPGLGQTAKFWRLMKDGKPRTIQQIHAVVGSCRLNSRVAEARKRFNAEIACWYADGTYVYQVLGSVSDSQPQAQGSSASARQVSEPAGAAVSEVPYGSDTRPEQLALIDATRDALNETPHGAVVVGSMLDRVDEAYASRLADRLRAEDSHRRLRVVPGAYRCEPDERGGAA